MTQNQVLESTKILIQNPKYVHINKDKIKETAKRFADENLEIPSWRAPVFPDENNDETIEFFLLGNSINFAYTDFTSKQKWATTYKEIEWKGAYGLWASLKRALDNEAPILNGHYLKDISENDMQKLFAGNFEIPMFKERLDIFHEVGRVLCHKYDGRFINLYNVAEERLFNDGKGLVERLTSEFESFDDSVEYQGQLVIFDKRAQLAAAMIYGRFQEDDIFPDIDELTVFADYVLPKGKRDLGILTYADPLAKRVDNQKEIQKNSQEELEIRASTIHAADTLKYEINKLRTSNKVNALHLDYKLWGESRKNKDTHHHLTKTIAY